MLDSEEIERELWFDPVLSDLAGETRPDSAELRSFRRTYQHLLQLTLACLFHLVQQACGTSDLARSDTDFDSAGMFERAAEDRIKEAVWQDMMALDY